MVKSGLLCLREIVRVLEGYCDGHGGRDFDNPYTDTKPNDKTKKFPYRSKVNGYTLYVNFEVKGSRGDPVQRVVIHPDFEKRRSEILLNPGVLTPVDDKAYAESLKDFPKDYNSKTSPLSPRGWGFAFDFQSTPNVANNRLYLGA